MNPLLETLAARGLVEPIDLSFAKMLREIAPDDDETVALAGAVVSAETRAGHPCVDLTAVAGTAPRDERGHAVCDTTFPQERQWISALRASLCVGDGGQATPLVLDAAGRLYLYRLWQAEHRVAQRLLQLATGCRGDETLGLEESLERFAPRCWANEGQRQAARALATRRLSVITGGPGTGKTTTLVRALLVLMDQDVRQGRRPSRVALLAPTGKAAARLTEVMAAAVASLTRGGVDPELLRLLPASAITVHRALAQARWTGRLCADVVAVDEASMLDLELFGALLEAMPSRSSLCLIGDADQLASVEAGAVLTDIVLAAGVSSRHGDLGACVARLEGSHRFGNSGGIGALAAAVRAGDGDTALAVLEQRQEAVLHCPAPALPESVVVALLESHLEAFARAHDPLERLALLRRVRVLCAHRRGPGSCESVGAAIERALAEKFEMAMSTQWYNGRPVLVRSNQPRLDLANGEVGVVDARHGEIKIVFEGANGLKSVAPAQIRDYETTYAMTVHKAQGSEFDKVLLVLPRESSKILCRELLYTAVTRARERVELIAEPAVVRAACNARVQRVSGLAARLAGDAARRMELGA